MDENGVAAALIPIATTFCRVTASLFAAVGGSYVNRQLCCMLLYFSVYFYTALAKLRRRVL